MVMKKKMICALISVVLALSAVACGDSSAQPDTTTAVYADTTIESVNVELTETAFASANVPINDYEGAKFVILTAGNSGQNIKYYMNSDTEAENGDNINDAIYKRNLIVEERFNVDISQYDSGNVVSDAKKSISAGDDAYQLIIHNYTSLYSLATGGFLMNLLDAGHLNLEADWWDINMKNELTISDRLYFDTGDIHLYDDMRVSCAYFNKGLWEKYSLEDPYALVNEGKWIIDKMKQLGSNVTSDIDGNGTLDQYDLWGIVSEYAGVSDFYFGSGERLISNNNGNLQIEVGSEKSITVASDILEFMRDSENVFMAEKIKADDIWKYASTIFQEDRALIRTSCFENIPRDYRAMDTDFGVLPIPKYDESQEKHFTLARTDGYGVAIPVSVIDLDFVAIITESLACESMNLLRPAFYEVSLQGKVLRDNESEGMLDIIFGNKAYDIGYLYSIGGLSDAIRNQVTKKTADVSSAVAKVMPKAEKELQKLLDTYNSL